MARVTISSNNLFPGPRGPRGESLKAKIRLHDFVANTSTDYEGYADDGSLTSQPVWTITKIVVASAGTVTVTKATNAIWDNRYTTIYT